MADALFTVLDEHHVLPTELSRGPWDAGSLHGGPVGALVLRAGERALAASGADARTPVRLTLDLERPVPLAPLEVRTEIVRPGRKVQVAEVTVHDEEGRRLVRASVLASRRTSLDLPDDRPVPDDAAPAGRETAPDKEPWLPMGDVVAFHNEATEHRYVRGGIVETGPATDWIRLTVPVVAGEATSPWQRAAAAADFVNGISGVLSPESWTYINPDLTVTLHRLPVGEWIAVDAVTRIDETGVGTAEADLSDELGRIGRCVQTLLIQPR